MQHTPAELEEYPFRIKVPANACKLPFFIILFYVDCYFSRSWASNSVQKMHFLGGRMASRGFIVHLRVRNDAQEVNVSSTEGVRRVLEVACSGTLSGFLHRDMMDGKYKKKAASEIS